jgi:hypothetical protein
MPAQTVTQMRAHQDIAFCLPNGISQHRKLTKTQKTTLFEHFLIALLWTTRCISTG